MTLATEYFDYRRFTEGAEVSLGTKVVQYIHNTGGERGQLGPLHGTLRGGGTLLCTTGLGAAGRPFHALLAYAKLGQGKDSCVPCVGHMRAL